MGQTRYRLELPPDASHGVTVRLFAAAAAGSSPATASLGDDLRLVLSELLANAVERPTGSRPLTIELAASDAVIAIAASGIGEPGASDSPVDRWRIIEALCRDLRLDHGDGGSLAATMTPQPDGDV